MEFSFTQDQKLIRDAVRDLLNKECPSDLVREMEQDEKGYSPELWHKIAELGWLGLIYPEKYGGSDGSFMELTVFLEEMGRYLAPIPFLPTVILGGMSILYGIKIFPGQGRAIGEYPEEESGMTTGQLEENLLLLPIVEGFSPAGYVDALNPEPLDF